MKKGRVSKCFQKMHITLSLRLAIRGIPSRWQPDEAHIDIEAAKATYADEIDRLDPLGLKPNLFQSGVLGAALVTVALEPETVTFWQQVNEERWWRHLDGRIDPAGWLLGEIMRHTGNRDVAVRPEYQHYLFQSALAAALFWSEARAGGQPAWLTERPARVVIPELLTRVRTTKGQRHTQAGFRPLEALRGRLPMLAPSIIEHQPDLELAGRLAKRACSIGEFQTDEAGRTRVLERLKAMDIPNEMASPGALAAAVVTIAQDPCNETIWRDAYEGRWGHDPDRGSTVAGLITRSIQTANRIEHGVEGEAEVFSRCHMALKSYWRRLAKENSPRTRSLPRCKPALREEITTRWRDQGVPSGPTIDIGQVEATRIGRPQDGCSQPPKSKRGKGRGKTGKRGEKLFERFFERCALPRAGRLIDRTADQCGYDYAVETLPEPLWAVEVKTANEGPITFTEPEWEKAELMAERYWLAVVNEKAAPERQVSFLRDPTKVLKARKRVQIQPVTSYYVGAKDLREALEEAAADDDAGRKPRETDINKD